MTTGTTSRFTGGGARSGNGGAQAAEVIAVTGKGGVGKTSLSAILTRLLLERPVRLLLIDADPAVSVSYAVGERPVKTLGDFRQTVIESSAESAKVWKQPTREIIRDLITHGDAGLDILAMGRAEAKGCYCGINDLLRFGIEQLCGEYEIVLVDCEAGIEQVNRRAVHRIDKLVLVTDTSVRSMETIAQVRSVVEKMNEGHPFSTFVLVNRVKTREDERRAAALAAGFGLAVAAFIPEDENVLRDNADGKPLVLLPAESVSVAALRTFLGGSLCPVSVPV